MGLSIGFDPFGRGLRPINEIVVSTRIDMCGRSFTIASTNDEICQA